MAAGHVHALFVHGHSRLHRFPSQCKILALVLFVFAVVSTPKEAFWAFGVYALGLAGLARLGGLRARSVLPRLAIELPFVAFAFFLPIIGRGDRVDVIGLSLSVNGLWGAWNILAKGTLGVAASIIMASTTSVPEILHGLERLRLPRIFTAIAGFLVRYLEVATAEGQRMTVARQSRGYDPRWFWQVRALASTAGTLFIRSYERGERVHRSMLSRGYDGSLPSYGAVAATGRQWSLALTVPVAAATVSLLAWTVLR